ncbi:MAG: hypothetical protein AAGM38_16520 [Pseudomonadota bacterium]
MENLDQVLDATLTGDAAVNQDADAANGEITSISLLDALNEEDLQLQLLNEEELQIQSNNLQTDATLAAADDPTLTTRLPTPQAGVLGMSWKVDAGPMKDTGITIAALFPPNLDEYWPEEGENFGDWLAGSGQALWDSVMNGTVFISVKTPGRPYADVVTVKPSTLQVEAGLGLAQSAGNSAAQAILFGNVRAIANTPQDGVGISENVGVLVGTGATSRLFGQFFGKIIDVVGGVAAAAIGSRLPSAAGGVTAVTTAISNTARNGSYLAGVAWRGSFSTNLDEVTIQTPGNTFTSSIEDMAAAAINAYAIDPNNFGSSELANTKNQLHLEAGASYFQLSPANGGSNTVVDPLAAEPELAELPIRNHGDPGLALVQYLNTWGQSVARPEDDPGDAPLTYRDIILPIGGAGLPSKYFVRHYENISSGPHALEVVDYLKDTLSEDQYDEFLEGLRPLAEPLGLNLGLSELNPTTPDTPKLIRAREFWDRDYDKDSDPRPTVRIIEIPDDQYQLIRENLGIDQLASDGETFLVPDYISPDLPTDPPLFEDFVTTEVNFDQLGGIDPEDLGSPLTNGRDGVDFFASGSGADVTGTAASDLFVSGAAVDTFNGAEGRDFFITDEVTNTQNIIDGGQNVIMIRAAKSFNIGDVCF